MIKHMMSTYWRVLLTVPLMFGAIMMVTFTTFPAQHASMSSGLPDHWWTHLTGEKTINAVQKGVTIGTVENNLDHFLQTGYHIINLDWPVAAGPSCIFAGFSAADYQHADPRLHNTADAPITSANPETADVTAADQDFANFTTAAHNKGMAVISWFNPEYMWVGSPLFKQAEADVATYGPIRANQPTDSPARYFVWSANPGGTTVERPADSDCFSGNSSATWIHDSAAGGNYYQSRWANEPSGDFGDGMTPWSTYITNAIDHWMDAGVDGFIFDAPGTYIGNGVTVVTNAVHARANKVAWGETGTSPFDGGEQNNMKVALLKSINTNDPTQLDPLMKGDRGPQIAAEDYTPADQTSNYFTQPDTNHQLSLFEIATLESLSQPVIIWRTAVGSGWPDGYFTMDDWPGGSDQAKFKAITDAAINHPAMQPSASHVHQTTNDDTKYYAFTKTSYDGSDHALVVLNFQSSSATITVDLANAGLVSNQTPTDLLNGGNGPQFNGTNFTMTLPAYGYGFYGVRVLVI